jgi:hypothetical protein
MHWLSPSKISHNALITHPTTQDQLHMFEFLSAASTGDLTYLNYHVLQGKDVNATDYDGRTGLMLAARENQEVGVCVCVRMSGGEGLTLAARENQEVGVGVWGGAFCACICTHIYTHTYTHTCTHTHKHQTHTHAHAYVHVHACAQAHSSLTLEQKHAFTNTQYIHTNVKHTHTHTHTHARTCTHTHAHTRTHIQEMVDALLRFRADAAKVDKFGYTALFEAARMGHDDCVQLLLDRKAP